ncbi:MAG: 3-phosphoshikimate 1-carboxyvinyltransferase [Bacteroidales bacterium]
MKYSISAQHLKSIQTEIILPSSKSIANRALLINSISANKHPIQNLSESDDTQVLHEVLQSSHELCHIGHAGTAMRFLTAFLSQVVGEWTLTGSARMKQRPIGVLVDALRTLGAQIEYAEQGGFPPLLISGRRLHGGVLSLDGSVSSQYISALLLIAPTLLGGLRLKLTNRITSRSYIEMTLGLMAQYGVKANWLNDGEISIEEQQYRAIPFTVESDWSAASYWYELLALLPQGELFLPNISLRSLQGDCAIASWFEAFGVHSEEQNGGIWLKKNQHRQPAQLKLDFLLNPDMAQTMAVLCVMLKIPFHFSGLETLKIKETNRIAALQNELAKFGASVAEPQHGELSWDGSFPFCAKNKPLILTYHDHRMALAFAPAALLGEIEIDDPMVITKSYPRYYDDLRKIGFKIAQV